MSATHGLRRVATLVVVAGVSSAAIASGAGGAVAAPPAKHRTSPPVFSQQPPAVTKLTSATFAWVPTTGSYSHQSCKLDSGSYASCAVSSTAGTKTYTNLANGRHTFSLNVKSTGKAITVTKTWTVDTQPPPPPVLSQPATPTSSTAVSISIVESDATATLTCALDAAVAGPCTTRSTFATSGLGDGSHTLVVTATDAAGNSSSSNVTWVVDTTAPAAVIVTPPASPTKDATAPVTFSDSDPSVDHFGCALNGNPEQNPCTSPWVPTSAPVQGLNTVVVTAYDAVGNANDAGSASWIFDSLAPAIPFIIDGPASPTNQVAASIDFSDTDPTSTFQCRLDSSSDTGWAACTSPWSNSTDLTDGSHTFEVRAVDTAGNVSGSATHTWSVDHTLVYEPVTFLSGPDDPSNDRSPSFDFDVSDTNSLNPAFTCSLDGAPATACDPSSNPVAVDLSSADEGLHTFTVVAVYAGGSSAPAGYAWHLDTTKPAAPVVAAVPSLSRQAVVAFTDASSDAATFTCSLDGGSPVHCTSPFVVSAAGSHTGVTVVAADQAGNISDPSASSNAFTVKPSTTAPTFVGSVSSFTTAAVVIHIQSTDAGDTLACSLDGAAATPCTDGTWTSSVADGNHTLTVTATDSLDNKASAGWHFTVTTTTTPPGTTPPGTTPPGTTPPGTTPPGTTPPTTNAPTVVLGSTAFRTTATWRSVRNAKALGRSYVVERAAGASVAVTFRGHSITWFGVTGPDMGLARVYVDNHLRGTVNTYASTRHLRVAHTIGHLRAGSHVLRIVVLGKKADRHAKDVLVALDGVTFAGHTLATPKAIYSWRSVHVGAVVALMSDSPGAALTATFNGTAVAWTDVTGPSAGRVIAYVDGISQGFVDDRATTPATATHTLTGLTGTTHVLRLVVASTKSRGAPVTVLGISS